MTNLGLVHHSCQLLAGLFVLPVLGSGCLEGECPDGGDPDPDAVEEAVWAVALDRAWWNWVGYTDWVPIYVFSHTTEESLEGPWEYDRDWVLEELPSLDPGVFDDFVAKNAVPVDVPADLDTEQPYVLLDETPDRWPLYGKKKYSLVTLSRVGVDGCGAQALVYWQMFCGWLCGNGDYVLVEWNHEGWTIAAELENWVSR